MTLEPPMTLESTMLLFILLISSGVALVLKRWHSARAGRIYRDYGSLWRGYEIPGEPPKDVPGDRPEPRLKDGRREQRKPRPRLALRGRFSYRFRRPLYRR